MREGDFGSMDGLSTIARRGIWIRTGRTRLTCKLTNITKRSSDGSKQIIVSKVGIQLVGTSRVPSAASVPM